MMKFIKLGKYRLGIDLRELISDIKGVGSICENGEHCLFFDLDDINEKMLTSGITAIQRGYDLGNCYVLRTSSSSYHAVFLDKMSRGMVINVHDDFRDFVPDWRCEGLINHDISSLRRRYWTLRISDRKNDKIRYVKTIRHKSSFWKKSNAHRILLNKLHGLDIRKTGDFDNCETLVFDRYSAKKKLIS